MAAIVDRLPNFGIVMGLRWRIPKPMISQREIGFVLPNFPLAIDFPNPSVRMALSRLATARIVIDTECDVPVHYEAYEWPAKGQKPFLSETYSYYDLKLDIGLTDRDFDPDNPEYAFP